MIDAPGDLRVIPLPGGRAGSDHSVVPCLLFFTESHHFDCTGSVHRSARDVTRGNGSGNGLTEFEKIPPMALR